MSKGRLCKRFLVTEKVESINFNIKFYLKFWFSRDRLIRQIENYMQVAIFFI